VQINFNFLAVILQFRMTFEISFKINISSITLTTNEKQNQTNKSTENWTFFHPEKIAMHQNEIKTETEQKISWKIAKHKI